MKCDVIDVSLNNGLRQPFLFSYTLDKPSGYKVFCEADTIHYKRVNRSVLNTVTFLKKMITMKKLILIEKRWLLHYKRSKLELLNEL